MVASSAPSRALEVAGHIEELIGAEGMQPGDRIATKDQVRERFGVARATVNEAVKLLQERGRITLRPGPKGGLFVVASDPQVQLGRFLLAVGMDAKGVADAMAVRDFLEEMVLTEAVEHRTERDVRELRGQVGKLDVDADIQGLVDRIWSLHRRIAQVTPNATLRATYCGLVDFIRSSVHGQPPVTAAEDFARQRVLVHADLVEVIASGDVSRVPEAIERHNAIV